MAFRQEPHLGHVTPKILAAIWWVGLWGTSWPTDGREPWLPFKGLYSVSSRVKPTIA